MSDFKYGDVLRISDAYLAWVPTAYSESRCMFIAYQPKHHRAEVIVLLVDPRQVPFHSPERTPGQRTDIEVGSWQVDE